MHYSYNSPLSHLIIFVFVSGLLMLSCNSSCDEKKPLRSRNGAKPVECMDGDTARPLNSTWRTEDCRNCTCTEGTISCCPAPLRPLPVDSMCECVQNKATCEYEVRRKDNSSEPCILWGVM
ncbi:beta-microseminoprotein-like [Hyperolius riggenbachi]|uniref:beta-microseminoprotein-like n=1 Tax=Hyperolius riggenbachi TaxID=752182 RepID=UPI0035A3662F